MSRSFLLSPSQSESRRGGMDPLPSSHLLLMNSVVNTYLAAPTILSSTSMLGFSYFILVFTLSPSSANLRLLHCNTGLLSIFIVRRRADIASLSATAFWNLLEYP